MSAASVSRTIGIVSVFKGGRPGRAPSRQHGKHKPIMSAAVVLKPGEWLVWKDAPKVLAACRVAVKKWAEAASTADRICDIEVYRTVEGQTIIACPDEEDFLEPAEVSPRPRGRA